MDKNIIKIIQDIQDRTLKAAEDAYDTLSTAGKNVTGAAMEKADYVRVNFELMRLRNEQQDVFAEIGKLTFKLKAGEEKIDNVIEEENKTIKQRLEELFVKAEQLGQEELALKEKLADDDAKICTGCGKICKETDVFCAGCGKKF